MIEYPKMLYKDGGNVELEAGFFFTCTVNDKSEEKQKIERGWKHKPVLGDDGLDERYKLESENEELKRQLEELQALKEQKKDMIESGEATEADFNIEDDDESEELEELEEIQPELLEENSNPEPKTRGRRKKDK